jgi:hypothetical protein
VAYITPLNEQTSSCQQASRKQCQLRYGDVHVISTTDSVCGSHAFQHNFQRTEVHTLSKMSAFIGISWQAFSTYCYNTSKSFISDGYIKVFRCPHSQKSRGLRSGDHTGQLTGPPSPISTVHLKSASGAFWQCGENGVVPHHAWITCVVLSLMKRHMFQEYGKIVPQKRWQPSSVSLLGKTVSPKSWSPQDAHPDIDSPVY